MNKLTHKGYAGSAEVSLEDECMHGRILFINDVITYEGENVAQLKSAFKDSVDRYLQHCKETGKQPDRACSGSFNVRLGPVLHRQAAVAAEASGTTLNDFVLRAVEAAVEPPEQKVIHEHHVIVDDLQLLGRRAATSNTVPTWEAHGLTH